MKLFVEQFDGSTTQVILEKTETGEKKYYIEGIFAQAEIKNRNGRLYPKKVLESALEKYQPTIKARRALGELNHPNSPSVNPERASHLIEKLEWEGNNIHGRAKILSSLPMGKIAKGLIDEGVSFGVSTRGMGTLVEQKGVKIVQNDFNMATIDLVSDPSSPDAWVNGLMENAEWIFNAKSGSWVIAEEIQNKVKKMSKEERLANQAILFENFLKSIR